MCLHMNDFLAHERKTKFICFFYLLYFNQKDQTSDQIEIVTSIYASLDLIDRKDSNHFTVIRESLLGNIKLNRISEMRPISFHQKQ